MLQMTQEACKVFSVAWEWIDDNGGSIAQQLASMFPECITPSLVYSKTNRESLMHLMPRSKDVIAREHWSAEIEEAFATTLTVIGTIQPPTGFRQSPADVYQELILFPMVVQKQFIELVEASEQRALGELARYFELFSRIRLMWWINDAPESEIHEIQNVLPQNWRRAVDP